MDLVHNYQEGIKALAFRSAQELAIVARGGQLKSWNLATGEKTALQLASAINDAVFSGDASKLAFIASSNPFKVPIKQFLEPSISVRDNITGRIIVKIDRVEHALLSLSLDGSRLACCIMPDHESFTDTQVVVFELTPHRSTKRSVIPGPLAHVALVALSPNGCKLAVFGEEKSTRLLVILDIETCEQEQTFPVSEWITCMSFSPDGATLTVVLEKKEFRQVDLATGEVQMIRKHCRHDVVAFAPDGLRIATAPRKANGIEVWNSLGNPDNVLYQKPPCDLDNCLPLFALCPDGSVAATARIKSNTILLVDIASKGIKHEVQACGVPEAVAFSHDGTTMAAKTLSYVSEKEDDGEMDLTTGDLDDIVVIEKHISTNRDKCWLEFWNIETIPSLRFRKTFPVAYRKSLLAVSPDGTRVALALIDDTQAGASRGTTVEECDVLRTYLVRRYHVQQPAKMSKIRYSADGEWLELINYKPSEPPGITTTTRIRLWQFEYAWGYWAREPVTEHAISKWHIQKYHFPRTGIWVTEDEAWIRYDRHYILYIPAHLRPMQHVYLGTSFDSVCDGTGGAVIGWITVEGLFTSFKIDLNKLRLAISGDGDEG
jgi:WD40 repeat protein